MDGGLMANNPGGVLFLEAIREIDAKNFSGVINGSYSLQLQ
jgi:hypothetical protein